MIRVERWQSFSEREQLGHIAAELSRAEKHQTEPAGKEMLERALELIDLTLVDPKWRRNFRLLLILRAALAEVYIGMSRDLNKIIAAF